jgi:hypothetical protein
MGPKRDVAAAGGGVGLSVHGAPQIKMIRTDRMEEEGPKKNDTTGMNTWMKFWADCYPTSPRSCWDEVTAQADLSWDNMQRYAKWLTMQPTLTSVDTVLKYFGQIRTLAFDKFGTDGALWDMGSEHWNKKLRGDLVAFYKNEVAARGWGGGARTKKATAEKLSVHNKINFELHLLPGEEAVMEHSVHVTVYFHALRPYEAALLKYLGLK